MFTTHREKRVSGLVLGLLLLVSAGVSTPRPAYAFDITWDLPNSILQLGTFIEQTASSLLQGDDFVKEYVLDPLAWIAKNVVLESLAQSLTNWARSGFQGSPAFVTDLEQNLQGVGDTVANRFVQQLQSDGRIDSPFRTRVVESTRNAYFRSTGSGGLGETHPYTLRDSCPTDAAFLSGDFLSGGFDCWSAAWRDPLTNTPEGSAIQATDALFQRVRTAQDTRQEEFNWSGGFLSFRSCPDAAPAEEGATVDLTQTDQTVGCSIQTPGSVASHAINKTMVDLGIDIQVSADEIDEAIAGFVSNMLQDAISDSGLLGGGNTNTGGRGTPTTTNANIAGSFLQILANQKARIEQYKSAWDRINGAALAAKTKLEACNTTGATAALASQVTPVLTEAGTALTGATSALTAINSFQTRLNNPQDPNNSLDKVSADYTTASRSFPQAPALTRAQQESLDSPPPSPPSLYRKMTDIVSASCSSFNASEGG